MHPGQSAITSLTPARRPRLVYEYTIPPSLRTEECPHASVGLHILTADEELIAAKAGGFNVLKQQYEAAKIAIGELDGKPTDPSTGQVDTFWNKCGPKMRSLILQKYNRISAPTTEEEDSFFGSEKIKVP